jgi:hypothetical protein
VHERLFEAFTYLVRIGPEDVPEGELRLAFAELMGREATGFSSDIDAETRIIALLMRAVHFMGFCYPLRYPIGINRN